jgi:hypothetical protein
VTIPVAQGFPGGTVTMFNANDGWMVVGDPFGPVNSEPRALLHYQHGTWSLVPLPTSIAVSLDIVTPVGADDVWLSTVSAPTDSTGNLSNRLIHLAHGEMITYTLPKGTGVDRMAFPASNDGWMVGSIADASTNEPVLMHFNGTGWTKMALPASFTDNANGGSFTGISLASAQEGFAIGESLASPSAIDLYHLHQGQWQAEQLPLPSDVVTALEKYRGYVTPTAITMVSPNEAWVFLISDLNPTTPPGDSGSLIYHYVDGTWSLFER